MGPGAPAIKQGIQFVAFDFHKKMLFFAEKPHCGVAEVAQG